MINSVLFVCLGNICRSPAAEGIFKKLIEDTPALDHIKVDSCGVGDWHIGSLPHERVQKAALSRGVVLSCRARLFHPDDLGQFDLILAADREVLGDIHRYASSPNLKNKIMLFTEYSTLFKGQDVPDPYYGSDAILEQSLDIIEDSCRGLLEHIERCS